MTDVRIATRGSQLALAQTHQVIGQLKAAHPGLSVEVLTITTSGDRDRTSPVAALTEIGAFVRSVQAAVLDGRADLAVHSGKDLPTANPPELIAIYPERISPWDALCGSGLSDLAPGSIVGTGSPRRAAQLLALRPDLVLKEIRGNVDTRLAKVADGQYHATVLAEAGLTRIGRREAITETFSLDTMVPAAAQGALTLEAIAGSEALTLAMAIDHSPSRRTVGTERAVLEISQAGCRSALGVRATEVGEDLFVTGFVDDEQGPRRAEVRGPDGNTVATELCHALGIHP